MHFYLCSDYSAVHILLSFLTRSKGQNNRRGKRKKPNIVKTWDQDIICIPKRKFREDTVSFPRKAHQGYLASCGLVGKLHITSEMSAKDVRSEICSVFKGAMQYFPFLYLYN